MCNLHSSVLCVPTAGGFCSTCSDHQPQNPKCVTYKVVFCVSQLLMGFVQHVVIISPRTQSVQPTQCWCFCFASSPSIMLLHLRSRSAQAAVRAATLKQQSPVADQSRLRAGGLGMITTSPSPALGLTDTDDNNTD